MEKIKQLGHFHETSLINNFQMNYRKYCNLSENFTD